MTDEQFFTVHADRQCRIRKPGTVLIKDEKRRATYYGDEMFAEFMSLGPHKKDRRRVIVYRVPKDNPHFDPQKPKLLAIPFLLFSDETLEDRDDVLLPVLDGIMQQARASY